MLAAHTTQGCWTLHTVLEPTREMLLNAPGCVADVLARMFAEAHRKIVADYPGAELVGFSRHDNTLRHTVVVYLRHRIPQGATHG